MSTLNVFRLPCLRELSRSWPNCHQGFHHVSRRKYATYHDTESSVLSQSLDTKQRAVPMGDSVGPFRLGLAQSSLRKDEKVLKWSELSTGGKGT
jgi:mitochondrial import inner membrane translocase subunit TIM21